MGCDTTFQVKERCSLPGIIVFSEDDALVEILRYVRENRRESVEFNFGSFTIQYIPVSEENGDMNGVLVATGIAPDNLLPKLQAAQEKLNGNQLRESTL